MYDMKTFCCGLNLKHGTIIIGIVQSIFAFMILVLSAAYAENPHELVDMSDPSILPDLTVLRCALIIIAVGSALQCVFSIFLIFGAETNRPVLFLPWLTLSPICVVTYMVATLIAIVHHADVNKGIFVGAHLVITVIICTIAAYKFLAVHSFYKHLRSLNF